MILFRPFSGIGIVEGLVRSSVSAAFYSFYDGVIFIFIGLSASRILRSLVL
jgi:hypothetical protein